MRAAAIIVCAALAVIGGACGGDSDEQSASTPATTTAVATGSAREIVGEWERETTCAELVDALRNAGMTELVDEFVAGNGFIPGIGVDDPEEIDVTEPCKGLFRAFTRTSSPRTASSARGTGTAKTSTMAATESSVTR